MLPESVSEESRSHGGALGDLLSEMSRDDSLILISDLIDHRMIPLWMTSLEVFIQLPESIPDISHDLQIRSIDLIDMSFVEIHMDTRSPIDSHQSRRLLDGVIPD